jgi:hypothetical protein
MVVSAVLAVAAGLPARAAVIVVDTDADGVVGPLCDIRDAITAANNDNPVGGCEVGGNGADVIDLTGIGPSIELTNGVLPTIQGDVTINGSGAESFTIDGLDTTKIFVIGSGNVAIQNLTLANGLAATDGRGGCVQILQDASVTLSAVRVTGCAAGSGGGIAIDEGSLNLAGSLIDANTTTGAGGAGIHNRNGSLWITTTTVSGNVASGEASVGGGIASIPADGQQGGITRLYSSTIADNGASSGGNVFTDVEMATSLTHTLIAVARAGGNCVGALTSSGYNLSTDASCALAAIGDLVSTPAALDVLGDNGGATATHALLAGSAAIDGGSPLGCFNAIGQPIPFDQRGPGYPRRTNHNLDNLIECDIGAFETVPEPLAGALGITAMAALALLTRRRSREFLH